MLYKSKTVFVIMKRDPEYEKTDLKMIRRYLRAGRYLAISIPSFWISTLVNLLRYS